MVGLSHPLWLDASDLGLELLRKLREIKRTYFRVAESPVRVFEDVELLSSLKTSGVSLEEIEPGSERASSLTYPAKSAYPKGVFVSWEWDPKVTFGPAWYLSEEIGVAEVAWRKSALFIGRAYPVEWGLQYRVGDSMTLMP